MQVLNKRDVIAVAAGGSYYYLNSSDEVVVKSAIVAASALAVGLTINAIPLPFSGAIAVTAGAFTAFSVANYVFMA